MKFLMAICLMLIGLQASAFGVPENMVLVCVQDCKYGMHSLKPDGHWTTVPTDVKTFTYHVVVDRKNRKAMFYAKPLPENSDNVTRARTTYLDGNKLRSVASQDPQTGDFLEVGSYTDEGEFFMNQDQGSCVMKLRQNLGKGIYQIDCKDRMGEFDVSGILARTQREQPLFP